MYQTPWTKKVSASSVTSDRLRPKTQQQSSSKSKINKSKNTESNPSPPQTKALRTLHALRRSLQDSSTSTKLDPTGGCFCQARIHPLSTYTPICTSCALPLCNLAAPAYLCPSCSEPLLSPGHRGTLLARIETEIADVTLKEQLAHERAEEERRAAIGAFPSLTSQPLSFSPSSSAYPTPSPSPSPKPPLGPPSAAAAVQTHKVLSLTSKSRKPILTTVTTKPKTSSNSTTPAASRPSSPQPTRVPRPADPVGAVGKSISEDRPFENLLVGSLIYVPPARVGDDEVEEQKGGGSRRRRRGKGKNRDTAAEGAQGGSGDGKNVEVGTSSIGEASGGA